MEKNAILVFLSFLAVVLCSGCGGGGGGGSSVAGESKGLVPGIAKGSSYDRHTRYYYDPVTKTSYEGYYTIDIKNGSGRIVQSIDYTGPGADGVWYTSDDVVDRYRKYLNTSQQGSQDMIEFAGMGPDGTWFTDDDIVRVVWKDISRNAYFVYAAGYADPGPDGKWMTDDDPVERYWDKTYDSSGNITGSISYKPGYDGIFHTTDDVEDYREEYLYDCAGRKSWYLCSTGKGLDDQWFTADDSYVTYVSYLYDDNGQLERMANYYANAYNTSSNPGSDGMLMTTDDIPISYCTYEYDQAGRKIWCDNVTSPGDDGLWFTDDDPGALATTYTYDSAGNLTEEFSWTNTVPDGTGTDYLFEKIEHLSSLHVPEGRTVIDATPPSIIYCDPPDGSTGVYVGTKRIYIEFSEDVIMYPGMIDLSSMSDVEIDNVWRDSKDLELMVGDAPLKPNTTYSITLKGIMDKAGNVMPTQTISFTTGDADTEPPAIAWSSPADGETGVSVNIPELFYQFDEPVIFSHETISSPGPLDLGGNRVIASENSFRIDLTGITLEPDSTYSVTFDGVLDLVGNSMPSTTLTFTTGD